MDCFCEKVRGVVFLVVASQYLNSDSLQVAELITDKIFIPCNVLLAIYPRMVRGWIATASLIGGCALMRSLA